MKYIYFLIILSALFLTACEKPAVYMSKEYCQTANLDRADSDECKLKYYKLVETYE